MSLLKNTPFLTQEEFDTACDVFHKVSKSINERKYWNAVYLIQDVHQTQKYLKIVKELDNCISNITNQGAKSFESLETSQQEEDDEAISKIHGFKKPLIEYHIVLSPSYRVPVLYILFHNTECHQNSLLDKVYDTLVPLEFHAEMQETGIMGAISYGDHPVLGIPALFVHPCNTADALINLNQYLGLKSENYIQTWLGIVGGCVGLRIPVQMVEAGLISF